ncbi:phosphatidylcholine synthase [Actinomyces sp. B33]|uniref:CDP-alcohol phosphatidyltransferase family protein n=1 Tax=Actinomyces sp. B33 TaxID=2942131 RepID=UPI0023422630|nr:phosphatidylcholine synthase [Actinomyces sp. B33]MDC4232296.1 phosphatidylcholine synthase [Actinomyces sp. B33]
MPALSISFGFDRPTADPSVTLPQRAVAWVVHLFTLSGIAWAALATISLINGDIAAMWAWLGVALVVDGVDGTLARRARVGEAVPWFDGSVLDIVIDYLTWTFLPALFMYLYLPLGPTPVALTMFVLILASSIFCYANAGEKSVDNYFVGFPAAWNVVAVIMYVLQTSGTVNIVMTIAMAALTLVPLHYTHPMRCSRFRSVTLVAVVAWIASTGVLVALVPAQPLWALVVFWVSGGWFVATCLIRSFTGPVKA